MLIGLLALAALTALIVVLDRGSYIYSSASTPHEHAPSGEFGYGVLAVVMPRNDVAAYLTRS